MLEKFLVALTSFFILTPVFPEPGADEAASRILRKLDEIDSRLKRVEQDIRQIQLTLRRLPGEKAPFDVRQTPEYRDLEGKLHMLQERTSLRNPAKIWEALGDPRELSQRLDMLLESFGPTISSEATREEFNKDVAALKEKIGKDVSDEELYQRARKALSERLAHADNDREKAWLSKQLEGLEQSEGEDRKNRIDRFVRSESLRALYELARKHSIPREEMTKNGLAFIGYAGRPAPKPGRHDRGGHPGPPSRGERPPTRTTPER
jgi:hypothetical protein